MDVNVCMSPLTSHSVVAVRTLPSVAADTLARGLVTVAIRTVSVPTWIFVLCMHNKKD